MVNDALVLKAQFQVAIAAGLLAVTMFLYGLIIPSGILLALSALLTLCVPLTFLVGMLYVIYRKD